jgi:hypothetical protein
VFESRVPGQPVPVQEPEEAKTFVNGVADLESPRGKLRAMAIGSAELSVAGEVIRAFAQIPVEPMDITWFQRLRFVSMSAMNFLMMGA